MTEQPPSPSYRPRHRLLTIGHSYVVGVNRRFAHEMARLGDWEVTAVTPSRFRGDLGWHELSVEPGELCAVEPVATHCDRPIHLMVYGRRLHALLKEPWDLVHCWEEPYVAAAAQVAAATPPRVPLVFSTFQNISKRYPPPFGWIERFTLERADGVVALGRTALEVLTERGFPRTRASLIPPGVDTARFAPDPRARAETRVRLGWAAEDRVVGFVGRFVPEKGLNVLTRSLDALRTPWRALFVGGGPLERPLRAWAARHRGRVDVRTGVAHADVPRWLNAMDVLCAPSQTTARWREQFGRMITEAFACGVAVVASRSGEIPFVVADAGVLVDEADVATWSTTIERLLSDDVHRAEMSARGRSRALAVYDWPIVVKQHEQFFKRLLAGRVPVPGRVA